MVKKNHRRKQGVERLLRRHCKDKTAVQPVVCIYLTSETLKLETKGDFPYLKSMKRVVGDKFLILLMRAHSEKEVRMELWQKGKRLYKTSQDILRTISGCFTI
jgi:hypothetical protein